MTPRSLFNIILKVIGIFFIKNILIETANILPALPLITKDEFRDVTIIGLVIIILEVLIYVFATYVLIFKTNWIIDKLKLDAHFQQQEFNLNIHRSTILSIAIIVIGGIIIVDNIPLLAEQLIYFIRMKKQNVPETKIDYVVRYAAKLLVGIFLVVYQRTLVNFIEYKQRRNKSFN